MCDGCKQRNSGVCIRCLWEICYLIVEKMSGLQIPEIWVFGRLNFSESCSNDAKLILIKRSLKRSIPMGERAPSTDGFTSKSELFFPSLSVYVAANVKKYLTLPLHFRFFALYAIKRQGKEALLVLDINACSGFPELYMHRFIRLFSPK